MHGWGLIGCCPLAFQMLRTVSMLVVCVCAAVVPCCCGCCSLDDPVQLAPRFAHPHSLRLPLTCSKGYPVPIQTERVPTLDPKNCRYRYYCPREVDRYTSPYHPLVLLHWNAHMNIQLVTNVAWSKYMLKYSMKVCVWVWCTPVAAAVAA